ncbi:MAG: hypothetical protein ABI851_12805 [Saprospiraceae bacterium]
MKNIFIIIQFIVIIILIYFLWKCEFKQKNVSVSIIENMLSESKINEYFGTKGGGRNIPLDSARWLVKNYVELRKSMLPNNTNPNNIERSIYFQVGPIIKRMTEISGGYNDSDLTRYGVRIYFGYYKGKVLMDAPENTKNKLTAVLQITRDGDLTDSYDGINVSDFNPPFINSTWNVGGLCPPNCPNNFLDTSLYIQQ